MESSESPLLSSQPSVQSSSELLASTGILSQKKNLLVDDLQLTTNRNTQEYLFRNCHKCNGHIGVPITYMSEHCKEQFTIVGTGSGALSKELGTIPYNQLLKGKALKKMVELRPNYGAVFLLDNDGMPKLPYNRIIIQRKPAKK